MLYKQYGSTGKKISAISCGGMRFTNPQDTDSCAQLVLHAHEKGINYFDTAPGYLGDNSEKIFGAALSTLKRDEYYISTKCGKADGDVLKAQMETSLKRLKVDYIDFFHIWCVITLNEWENRVRRGAVAAAIQAKEQGLIKHLCISSHLQGDQLKTVLDEGPFEGVLLGYNALNFPYRQAAVEHAASLNKGVMIMNPLGGGVIPNNPQLFDFIKSSPDESIVQAAIRFVISQPVITSALVGFSNTDHVDQACSAVENFTPLSSERLNEIRENAHQACEGICTSCGYCLPCPQGINIPQMMDAYNQMMLAKGNIDPMMWRFKYHWNLDPRKAKKCIKCGLCELRCTQHIKIQDRLDEILKIAEENPEKL